MRTKINTIKLEQAFQALAVKVEKETGQPFTYFANPFMTEQEGYKTEVRQQALEKLQIQTWRRAEIGKGDIVASVIAAIELPKNNLLPWQPRYGVESRPHQSLYVAKEQNSSLARYEAVLFDLFQSQIDDASSFSKIVEIAGQKYPYLGYLFFLKDDRRYLPIRPQKFEEIFQALDIDFKANQKCSWENYTEFIAIVKAVQDYLSARLTGEVRLIDAHSFLWTLGWALTDEPVERQPAYKISEYSPASLNNSILQGPELEAAADRLQSAVEFQEAQRQNALIGQRAEEIVVEAEKQRLRSLGAETLARRVEYVGNQPELGYDVRSFEVSGKIRHIEVKAVGHWGELKAFYLSANELKKSESLPNYYIYLVADVFEHNPTIWALKQPNLQDSSLYNVQPMSYRVLLT